ncbi:tyrosine recombinase XerC [Candidatus Sumerlaeota bacterium]|nr:tyrosine recombinase XerC [Candidatus Sumerlaeota bacterium]
MTLSDAIERYERFLSVERNLSPRTIKAYVYELQRLSLHLVSKTLTERQNVDLASITTDCLRSHLFNLQSDTTLSSATVARAISSLKGFFRFCFEQGFLEDDPSALIRSPKHQKRLPIYLVRDEVMNLLASLPKETWLEKRDFAIIVTLIFTGLRLQELVGIDLDDISFAERTLKVFGKGRKERLVPLGDAVVASIQNYLGAKPNVDDKALFLNRYSKRLHGRSIERIVKKAVISAGIPQRKITPHKLRHTFATLLHMSDVDIIEIQALLGHANISSTQIYTHTNAGRLRVAVDKLPTVDQGS